MQQRVLRHELARAVLGETRGRARGLWVSARKDLRRRVAERDGAVLLCAEGLEDLQHQQREEGAAAETHVQPAHLLCARGEEMQIGFLSEAVIQRVGEHARVRRAAQTVHEPDKPGVVFGEVKELRFGAVVTRILREGRTGSCEGFQDELLAVRGCGSGPAALKVVVGAEDASEVCEVALKVAELVVEQGGAQQHPVVGPVALCFTECACDCDPLVNGTVVVLVHCVKALAVLLKLSSAHKTQWDTYCIPFCQRLIRFRGLRRFVKVVEIHRRETEMREKEEIMWRLAALI